MKYLSVCAGIEAATCAWHHMGWEPVAFSEIEKFPSAVLAHHYPNVPNWGDMTKFKEWPDANIDVLVGGTPCQSFSIAGLRKGLDDPRGNLMLTYLAIAKRYRPEWLVWENVPGVLSSEGGRDFAALLRGLDELGYGWAYRVLDAQYFGVAQRRRRVFVVGHLGNWQRAAAVLFERHSLSGHPAPSRQARKGTAGGVALGATASGWPADVAPTLNAHFGSHQGQENQHISGGAGLFVPVAFDAFNQADTGDLSKTVAARNDQDTASLVSGCWWNGDEVAATLTKHNANGIQRMPDKENFGAVLQPIPYDLYQITAPVNRQNRKPGDPCHTLARDNAAHAAVAIGLDEEQNARIDGFGTLKARMEGGGFEGTVMTPAMQVRRLTPMECERLQGFPDGYTNIPWRGKPESPDGPRYKALGNSMAVPVMRWIGERINEVSKL